jgi:hypothetical protein
MSKIKVLLLFFLIIGFISLLQAQENFIVGIYNSIPVGDYGSTDYKKDAGFAKNGWGIMFEQKVTSESFPQGLTIGLHFSNHLNDLNNVAMEKALGKAFGGPYVVELKNYDGYNPLVVTIGPYYKLISGERFSLELKAGLGIMYPNINAIVVKVYDAQGSELLSEVLRFDSNPIFTTMFGSNLGYSLTENLRMILFAEYQMATGKIRSTYQTLPSSKSEFNISYVNIGLGLGWRFF